MLRVSYRKSRGHGTASEQTRIIIAKPYIVVNPVAGLVGDRPIAPQANLSDGLLDVVRAPKCPAAEMALLAAEVLLGKHISSDAVVFRRAKKISVQSRSGMWFKADGELFGNQPGCLPNCSSRVRFCA